MKNEKTRQEIENILNTFGISFMSLGQLLKNAGIKYTFSTDIPLPPHYRTDDGVVICSKRYASKDATIIGNIAIEV